MTQAHLFLPIEELIVFDIFSSSLLHEPGSGKFFENVPGCFFDWFNQTIQLVTSQTVNKQAVITTMRVFSIHLLLAKQLLVKTGVCGVLQTIFSPFLLYFLQNNSFFLLSIVKNETKFLS